MFKVGDKVKWTSQSSGFTRTKEGVVVAIINRESGAPYRIADKEYPNHKRMFDGWRIPGIMPNDKTPGKVGYFIEVRDGKTSRAMPKLYMPYPNRLVAVK